MNLLLKKNSHTILKKRYVDNLSLNKVLGVYKLNNDPLAVKGKSFKQKTKKIIKNFDLVIVSDYGHGFISKKSANIICSNSKYLAVNAQINAANIGYHSMKKYKNCDCVIINEREIRQEFRDKNEKIENLMKKLSLSQKIKNLIVTRGNEGSVLFDKNKFYYSDAFAKKAVDKNGAGDAMLSLVSLGLKKSFLKNYLCF